MAVVYKSQSRKSCLWKSHLDVGSVKFSHYGINGLDTTRCVPYKMQPKHVGDLFYFFKDTKDVLNNVQLRPPTAFLKTSIHPSYRLVSVFMHV